MSTPEPGDLPHDLTSAVRVALDAFGSDGRPHVEIAAAVLAGRAGIEVDLVGDPERLAGPFQHALRSLDQAGRERVRAKVRVIPASAEIAMDEAPAQAVRNKPDASLCVTVERAGRTGPCAAAVSAGHSGALLAAGVMRLGRSPGVDRPAILTEFPQVTHGWAGPPERGNSRESVTAAGRRTLLLDAGANLDCSPLNLVQFAVLGAVHARTCHGLTRPRVAVLANGVEATKGTTLTRATHALLSGRESPLFEFVGCVEPGGLFDGACDVAVTDGWTGNIALKLGEGAMAAWPALLREALRGEAPSAALEAAVAAVRARVDPDRHGGAPLVGVDGTLIICHGSCGPRALYNAIVMARRHADSDRVEASTEAIATHRSLFEAASPKRPKKR